MIARLQKYVEYTRAFHLLDRLLFCEGAQIKLNAVCRVVVLRRNKEDSELPSRAIDIYAQVADEYNVTIDTIQKWCKENRQLFNLPQKSC